MATWRLALYSTQVTKEETQELETKSLVGAHSAKQASFLQGSFPNISLSTDIDRFDLSCSELMHTQ